MCACVCLFVCVHACVCVRVVLWSIILHQTQGNDIQTGDLTAADYTVLIGDQKCSNLVITNEVSE